MIRWMLSALLALVVWSSAAAVETRDVYQYFFEDTFGDYREELQRARDEGKRGILLFFEMDECPFCHRMKNEVLNRVDVQDYYRENFLCFSVDIEGQIEVVDFAGRSQTQSEFASVQNRVRATPVFAFFDLQGVPVQRYTGATSGSDEFLWLGEFVAGEMYKSTNFTRYKRARKRAARQ